MLLRQHLATFIRRIPRLMVILYFLYRLTQPKYSVGVVGVIINEKHEILLVEHVFHPRQAWGLPGGWIGRNEDPEQAVTRELREELGLTIQVKQLLLAIRTEFNHLDFAYLCAPHGKINKLSYELLGYRWLQRHHLPELHPFHARAVEQAFLLLDKD